MANVDDDDSATVSDIFKIGACQDMTSGRRCNRTAHYGMLARLPEADHYIVWLCTRHARPILAHFAEHEHGEWDDED